MFSIRLYDSPEAVGIIVSPPVAEDIADALEAQGDAGSVALAAEIRYRLKLRPSAPAVDPAAGRFKTGRPGPAGLPAGLHPPGEPLPVLLTEGGFNWAIVRNAGDVWLYGNPGTEPSVAADLGTVAGALIDRRLALDSVPAHE